MLDSWLSLRLRFGFERAISGCAGLVLILGASGCPGSTECPQTTGEKGNALFSFIGCRPTATNALAAGGAESTIVITGATFSSATVADPTIATVTSEDGNVNITSGNPGTTELVIAYATGTVIDQTAITVKPTTALAVDDGWMPAAGPTIVAGPKEDVHVTTKNGDEVLIGTGAVKFSVTGSLSLGTSDPLSGDDATFTGTAGSGTLVASSVTANVTIPVTVVDGTKVDGFTITPATVTAKAGSGPIVTVSITAAGTPVYAGGCTWTTSSPVLGVGVSSSSTLGNPVATPYVLNSETTGTFTATCTLWNGMSKIVQVTFN